MTDHPSKYPGLIKKAENLLRQFDGPLTRELIKKPAKFGLASMPERLHPDSTTSAVCGYCSTGCSLRIHRKGDQAINITPDLDYPVNIGMACPKGWEALAALKADDRGTTPLIKDEFGNFSAIDWNTAAKTFVDRMKSIQEQHGKDSVAFLSTGQMPMEEMALLGSFAKFGMGVVHGDGNTRQCMATSVVSYKESFGFDAPPFAYSDFELSDTLIFFGANPCIAHPILWERVLKNPNNPKVIVVDPRLTETASAADQHVAIAPKGDLPLLYGIAAELIRNNWVDSEYISSSTEGFDEFKSFLSDWSAERSASEAGISVDELKGLAKQIHEGGRVSFWWTMGVNQSHQGVRTAQGIINLALMTGNIGKPGTGANSITGQTNAMGSRLFSNTTNLLGGRNFTVEKDRQDVAAILDIPVENIPSQNSLDYASILDAVDEGKIKALWIIATNPGHSWIDRSRFDRLVKKLDFLVVQDMYHSTETAVQADLYLPAAGWGEKEGTVINSERRIGINKKMSKAPGQALSDFNIFRLLMNEWGCSDMFKAWSSPEATFKILQKLSRGRPCDFTGIRDYKHIDDTGGIQWPFYGHEEEKERRLFENGEYYRPNKKALFCFEKPLAIPEPTCKTFPFVLLTGRGSASQWHTETRTAKSKILKKLYPKDTWVEMHPDDANAKGLSEGDWLTIRSARGSMRARAKLVHGTQKGTLFVGMHDKTTNLLTYGSFDPYSRQPSYKHCAVRLES